MGSFFSIGNKALDKLSQNRRPSLETKRCYNKKQRKVVCTDCKDVCRANVFLATLPDWDRCIGCGVCLSACRTRAIRPSETFLRNSLALIKSEKESVCIGCEKSSSRADMRVGCLASLPWEFLACLVLNHHVHLDMSVCAECDQDGWRTVFAKSLTMTQSFLGVEFCNDRIMLEASGEEQESMSRREAMLFLKKRTTGLVAQVFPSDVTDEKILPSGSIYAQMLISMLRDYPEDGEISIFTLDTIRVSTACSLCGGCERVCPSGAITVIKPDDGSAFGSVIHRPLLCSHCGLCSLTCFRKANVGWREVKTHKPTVSFATSVEIRLRKEEA